MPSFYFNLGPFKVKDLIKSNECSLINLSGNEILHEFVGIENARENSLTFLNNIDSFDNTNCKNSIIICNDKTSRALDGFKLIVVKDVQKIVSVFSNRFYRNFTQEEKNKFTLPKIGDNSIISDTCKIENGVSVGKNVEIGHGSVIQQNCIIGDNSIIGSNSVISNCIIGENVVIGNSTSIGQAGFGFSINKNKNLRIFHIGKVIIDKNVYVGSNCTFDRGSFGDTIIGENTYFDNLCHVAHNVKIGSNNVFAAMCGIAGSAVIGNNVLVGGQAGISGHIKVGNNVLIAAKSAVMSNIDDNRSVMGNPAIDKFKYIRKYKKQYG